MADIEKVKQGVKACWSEHWCHKCFNCPYKPDRDNDDACVERLGVDVLELLKDQKNLIDGLIEDQLKKDEEQQAEIERLKSLVKKKNRKIKKLMEDNYLNGGR